MKRKIYLSLFLMLSLTLSGCLGGLFSPKQPVSFVLELEWEEETPDVFEIEMKKGGDEHLLILEGAKIAELQLPAGTWAFKAVARDADGKIFAQSAEQRLKLRQEGIILTLTLEETPAETPLPEVFDLSADWRAAGVYLYWPPAEESFAPEIFRRSEKDRLWEKQARLKPGTASYLIENDAELSDEFALRLVHEKEGRKGPLNYFGPIKHALLDVKWRFEHDFSYLEELRVQEMLPAALFAAPSFEYKDLIARFHTAADYALRAELLQEAGLVIKRELPPLLAVLVEPALDSPLSLEEWSHYFQAEFYLAPNLPVQAEASPAYGAESYGLWNQRLLHLPQAWEISQGSRRIRIAVLDSGLDPKAFNDIEILPGYNFIGEDDNTNDDYGHGTQVAGIITQVMPQVSLQPVKVLDQRGSGTEFSVSAGILYAAGLHTERFNPTPAHILNMSLGQISESSLIGEAVLEVAARSEAIMVAAAGNYGLPRPIYPAAYPAVLAIGALTNSGGQPVRADYSNYAPDFTAPGGSKEFPIRTVNRGGRPSSTFGTSIAAPHAAGVIGLMLAAGTAPADVKPLLEATAVDLGPLGWDEEFGAGLINAHWALRPNLAFQLFVYSAASGKLVRQVEIPVAAEDFQPIAVPEGELFVKAWLDLGELGVRDAGDYFFRSHPFPAGTEDEIELELVLEEIPASYN